MSERWFNSLYLTLTRDEIEPIMRGHVSLGELRVLVALFDHVNRKTGECWPSHQSLAEKTNLSVSGVRKALARLEERGLVKAKGRAADDGRQISNLYTVTFGASPQGQGSVTPGAGGCPQSDDEPTTKEPTTKERIVIDQTGTEPEGFPGFWAQWPRKVGKGQARTAWRAALKKAPAVAIMLGLQAQLPTLRRKAKPDDSGQVFCPHASTWLNGERWEDETERKQEGPSWNLR